MASELPPGIEIEPVWAVEAAYAPDAPQKRPAVRAEHLARIAKLRAAGVIIEAGGYADWSGSLLLIRAASEEAALALIHDDVYWRTGVWSEATAKTLGRVATSGEAAGR
jgi:uncharacterized protein YciI